MAASQVGGNISFLLESVEIVAVSHFSQHSGFCHQLAPGLAATTAGVAIEHRRLVCGEGMCCSQS